MSNQKAKDLTLVTTLDDTDLIVASPADGVTASKAIAASNLGGVAIRVELTDTDIKAATLSGDPVVVISAVADAIIQPIALSIFGVFLVPYTNFGVTNEFKPTIGIAPFSTFTIAVNLNLEPILGSNEGYLSTPMTMVSAPAFMINQPFVIALLNSLTAGEVTTLSLSGTSTGTSDTVVGSGDASSNTGVGSGAEFSIHAETGTYSLNAITLVGQNFQAGDVLVFPGTLFGGLSPANDMTMTITAVEDQGGEVDDGDPANKLIFDVVYRIISAV